MGIDQTWQVPLGPFRRVNFRVAFLILLALFLSTPLRLMSAFLGVAPPTQDLCPAPPAQHFGHVIVMGGSTAWQHKPMTMIMIPIARPRNGLGLDIYEGRALPVGHGDPEEQARSRRGPVPVAGGPTRITRSFSTDMKAQGAFVLCTKPRVGTAGTVSTSR